MWSKDPNIQINHDRMMAEKHLSLTEIDLGHKIPPSEKAQGDVVGPMCRTPSFILFVTFILVSLIAIHLLLFITG